jgi:hypothetical protein
MGRLLIHIADGMQLGASRFETCGMVLKHTSRTYYSDFFGHDVLLYCITSEWRGT